MQASPRSVTASLSYVFLRSLNTLHASIGNEGLSIVPSFVPPFRDGRGIRILTDFPSTTLPDGRLILGPDSPSMDEPSGGTLRLSGRGILTLVFVTQADILTSVPSTRAYARASPDTQRSPTALLDFQEEPIASADCLVPIIIGARTLYQ